MLVSEATSKLIGFNPDGGEPLAISHYGITLKDDDGTELKKTETPIALSGGSGSFTITGLVTGNYTIDATGYVKNGETYAEVATGTSGEIFVNPTTDTETTILIDTWKEGNAESMTISVVMPEDVIAADGTVAFDGNLKYCLTEIGTGTETIPEKVISLTAGQALSEGLYTLTIEDDVPPGRYILTVSFTSESAVKEYSNADAVLVYPGLPVTGEISIDSHSVFDEDFTVSNALGEPLTIEGDGIYSTENGTFTVTLSNTLTASQNIVWYADGALLAENEGYTVADNVYTFKGVSAGEHYFVGIVYEEWKEASIGSIQLTISVAEPGFEFPSHFLYTDNGDGTCTITGENPDNPLPSHDGLTIPNEIKGLKVTTIGSGAFAYDDFSGNLVIPDCVTTIGHSAFIDCGFSGDLVIPDSVTIIDDYAFQLNDFTGNLVISNSITHIGSRAFGDCDFTGTLTLGNNVQVIDSYAFIYNHFTDYLAIPGSVIEIGSAAFSHNSFTQIFCETETQPAGWADGSQNEEKGWDYKETPRYSKPQSFITFWNISESEYQEIIAGNMKPVIYAGELQPDNTAVITIQDFMIDNLRAHNFKVRTDGAGNYAQVIAATDNGDGTYTVTFPDEGTSYELYLTGAGGLQNSDPVTVTRATSTNVSQK